MAQPGDKITYTFSGAKETEDVSAVDTLFIRRMDGASGTFQASPASGFGGQIKLARADVSALSKIEIFVGERGRFQGSGSFGRSNGGGSAGANAGSGGGSTEVIQPDGTLIAAADAGGGDGAPDTGIQSGGGGARGGNGGSSPDPGGDAQGVGFGGDGGTPGNEGENGGQELGTATLRPGGSTTKGGGSGPEENGEVVLAFDKPRTPTNLSLSENLATVGPTVDLSWSNQATDRSNAIYRAPGSPATFPDDFNEVATAPPGQETFRDSPGYDSTFSYVVTATLNGGESDPSAPASITTSSAGELQVTITNTNSPVTTGDTLELGVEIENIGDYRAAETIDADLEPQ